MKAVAEEILQQIETKSPNSWQELEEILFESSENGNSPWLFRGVNSCFKDQDGNAEILSSFQVYCKERDMSKLDHLQLECGLLRSFFKYANTSKMPSQQSGGFVWQLLALAEHHSVPTRIYNFSHNPYIALHFATLSNLDSPGEIWMVNPIVCHRENSMMSAFLKSRNLMGRGKVLTGSQFDQFLELTPEKHLADPSAALLLLQEVLGNNVVFIEPAQRHVRAITQEHVFAIQGNTSVNLGQFFRKCKKTAAQRVHLSPELKKIARRKIDIVGINERSVMGGLDGLALWLRRYYNASYNPCDVSLPSSIKCTPHRQRKHREETEEDLQSQKRRKL